MRAIFDAPRLSTVLSRKTTPPPPDGGERIIEPCLDDLVPDYNTELVMSYANG
jgi:hypothetical protein